MDRLKLSLKKLTQKLKAINKDIFLFILLSPLITVLIIDFRSFTLGWNEGSGGLIFALFFLIIEWYDARNELKINLTKKKFFGFLLGVFLFSIYFVAIYKWNLQTFLFNYGKNFAVEGGLPSWVWLWDYVVFASSLIISLTALFSIKFLKLIITPIVYSVGSALILLLDVFFPYQSIGFLAGLVPFIMNSVVFLLKLSNVKILNNLFEAGEPPWIYVKKNYLNVMSKKGFVILEVNWPCAGIFSLLIYSLIISILMVKLNAPIKRKIVYASLGALGTFFINIFRIYLIVLAILYSAVDLKVFHETIGEVLFIIWIITYLLTVIKIEFFISKTTKCFK
ncbi:MAG: archaeosortase/exosortase family protein [Candidatus Bathyarchaeia archaeon]